MKALRGLLGTALIVAASVAVLPAAAHGTNTNFVVDSTADGADVAINGVCAASSGACTLRAAIQESNNAVGGASISFAIAGSGVQRIAPNSALPMLSNLSGGITIDGFTQPGSAPNTDAFADNAVRLIEIAGQGPSAFDGLQMTSGNNTIRGINIHGFRRALWMYTDNSANNTLVGNLVGLMPDGTLDPLARLVAGSSCIVLQGGAHDNHVGVPGVDNRNTISGCSHQGVAFYNGGTTRNLVQNNIVGLDPSGTQRRPNRSHGVDINGFTTRTMVGGNGPGERNVVSGNTQTGVEISHGSGTINNSIIGNYIGTDVTGTIANAATRNNQHGVRLEGKPNCNNQPCGLDEGFETVTDNIIVNSGYAGIWADKGVHDSLIARNRIGLLADGTPAGNVQWGVRLEAVTRMSMVDNEIAFNGKGIQLLSTTTNPSNLVNSPSHSNTFSRNLVHDNLGTIPIDMLPMSAANDATRGNVNVNDDMRIPVLSGATPTSVNVSSCANCTIELFVAPATTTYGGSLSFVGAIVTNGSGTATATFASDVVARRFTATATNGNRSTSEFARNVTVPHG